MHLAGAAPVLGEEGHRVRHNFDHLAALVHVSAASQQEMAELVAGHMAVPVAGRADPDAALVWPCHPWRSSRRWSAIRLPSWWGSRPSPWMGLLGLRGVSGAVRARSGACYLEG